MSRYTDIDALLTSLGEGATVDEVEYALRDHITREVLAVLADRAAAGGGASFPEEWTIGENGELDVPELTVNGGPAFGGGTITSPLVIDSSDVDDPPLEVSGADLNQRIARFTRSNGDNILCVESTATFDAGNPATMFVGASEVDINLDAHGDGTHGSGFLVGTTENVHFQVSVGGGVLIQPAPEVSDNPFEVRLQDGSAGVRLSYNGNFYFPGVNARVTPAGSIITKANAAPDNADISAGECALWFDKTNGAAKLMVKAKQADGTVRTGELALT